MNFKALIQWIKVLLLSVLSCVVLIAIIFSFSMWRHRVDPNWVLISSIPAAGPLPATRAEIDLNSITENGAVRSAPMRITYADGDWTVFDMSFKCTNRGYRESLYRDRAHPGGYVAFVGSIDPPFHPVPPVSFQEAALNHVCGHHFGLWDLSYRL